MTNKEPSVLEELNVMLEQAYADQEPWFEDDPVRSEIQSLFIFVMIHLRYFSFFLTGDESIQKVFVNCATGSATKICETVHEIFSSKNPEHPNLRRLPKGTRAFLSARGPEPWTATQEFDLRCCLVLSTAHLSACATHLDKEDIGDSLKHYGEANRYYGMFLSSSELYDGSHLSLKDFSLAGVAARLATDAKQADKRLVKEFWDEWQRDPKRYRTATAFSRDMLDKFERLQSVEVIARWQREWKKTTTPPVK